MDKPVNDVDKRKSSPNWALLAALRFVLALIVVSSHLSDFCQWNPLAWTFNLSPFGAVAGFLIISGYSIRHSIGKESSGFYERRLNRIYPTYLFALLLSVVPFIIGGVIISNPRGVNAEAPTMAQFFGYLLMLQNIALPPFKTNLPAWSLAVECAFYLAAPLLIKLPSRVVMMIGLSSFVAFLFARTLGFGEFAEHTGIGGIVGLAWLWLLGWQIKAGVTDNRFASLLMVAPVFALAVNPQSFPATLGGFTVAAIVALVLYQNEFPIPERCKALALFAGEISYGFYILHVPLFWVLWVAFGIQSPWLLLAATFLVSSGVYYFIDKPLRHRKPADGKLKAWGFQKA